MPAPVAPDATFYALPDDILRVVAAFSPLLDLIALVQCSRRLTAALRVPLSRRLDNLFVVPRLAPHSVFLTTYKWSTLPFQPTLDELQDLFECQQQDSLHRLCDSSFDFCDANTDTTTTFGLFRLYQHYHGGGSDWRITGPRWPVDRRFVLWLERRHEQWQAAGKRCI